MPGMLLTITAPVMCLHGGQVQTVVINQRVKINQQFIVVQTDTNTIAGCSLQPNGVPFCNMAQWTVAATRVKANGTPVLLADSQAVCVATGTGVNIIPVPSRVKGV